MSTITKNNTILTLTVWSARLMVGAIFILSGFVKSVDLWGFVYKIEEYLAVWNVPEPRSIVFVTALLISGIEFIFGVMLVTGCYKRVVPWGLFIMMLIWLPLTGYIWLKDPVADCGCFGDFIILSNSATFVKNLILTVLLVFLLKFNNRINGLYTPYIQWLPLFLASFYIIFIGIIGYTIQPLLDFRSFPVGSRLLPEETDDTYQAIEFVYTKDGKEQIFTQDELPDSSWVFVKRKTYNVPQHAQTDFVIIDGDDNIAEEVIDETTKELLIIIPEYERADATYTYLFNELYSYIEDNGGLMVALVGGDADELEEWIDLSMAEYPIYGAESTMLKELSRGTMSIVYLEEGKIVWKRTAGSIDVDYIEDHFSDPRLLDSLVIDGKEYIRNITILFLSLYALLFLLDRSGRIIKWNNGLRKHRKALYETIRKIK